MYLSGVDPTRSDVVYARVPDGLGTGLWRSDDAGRRWSRVAVTQGPMLGFAVSPDGASVWVGGPDDGLWRSDDRGVTFARVSSFGPTCLRHDGAALWACADWSRAPFALGRSTDGGARFAPVLRFDDVVGPFACDPSKHGAAVCGWQWPGVSSQLAQARASLDASTVDALDASDDVMGDGGATLDAVTSRAPAGGGCACGVSSSGRGGAAALAALAAWIRSRRRRRAASTRPSRCSSSRRCCPRCG